ncbi:MAG: hypothetical protein JWQ07_5715 [Ramlibacter sp.]|nr:hypothetical protein [Ramlibacter sp.]
MPRLFILMAIVASLGVLDARSQARAETDYPYCLVTAGYAEGRCYYSTLEQCKAAEAGGYCDKNPFYAASSTPAARAVRKGRR